MKININVCSICRLRCPGCPVATMGYTSNIGDGYLKFNDFKKILDADTQIKKVEFENTGGIFLNPELLSIIEYAYRKNIEIFSGSVNLDYVTTNILEGLVKYQFSYLSCSIDGATEKTYNIYRVGGSFNTVMQNIQIINHFKKIYRSKFPKLAWQFIVFGHNEHEIPKARKIACDFDMEFFCKMSWDSNYSPIRDKKFVMVETGWPAVTREEYEKIYGISCTRYVCSTLWHNPLINWDGKILGCCWNIWSEFGGNAFKDGYINSINNERINYARQMLLGNAESRGDIPCSSCDIYQKIRSTKNYLTMNEISKPLWYRFARLVYKACWLKLQKFNNKK